MAIEYRPPVRKPIYRLGGAAYPGGPRVRALNDTGTFEVTNDAAGHMAATHQLSKEPAVDLGNGHCGEPVLAMAPGFAIPLFDPGSGAIGVAIEHGRGEVTEYWHLERHVFGTGGRGVTQGQTIGYLGNSGIAHCHLHLMLKLDGRAVDPEAAIFGDMQWHTRIDALTISTRVQVRLGTNSRTTPAMGANLDTDQPLHRGGRITIIGWVLGETPPATKSNRWAVYLRSGWGLRVVHDSTIELIVPHPAQEGMERIDREWREWVATHPKG